MYHGHAFGNLCYVYGTAKKSWNHVILTYLFVMDYEAIDRIFD